MTANDVYGGLLLLILFTRAVAVWRRPDEPSGEGKR